MFIILKTKTKLKIFFQSTPLRGSCKISRRAFNQSTKSISGINNEINVSSKKSSENRKAKFMELKLRLSNIIDDNKELSEHLKINRELLAKENKSRMKIENCCDKIEPEIAKICRGILMHVEKQAKNYSRNLI